MSQATTGRGGKSNIMPAKNKRAGANGGMSAAEKTKFKEVCDGFDNLQDVQKKVMR